MPAGSSKLGFTGRQDQFQLHKASNVACNCKRLHVMEENNELEKSIKPEYKSAIEYLSNQTNRLDKLTSQFNMLQTNPLLESGLFNATKKLQSQFNLIKGLNPLLPELANLKANSLALNMLRDTSLSISGLSSNPALKQLGESLLEAKKIAFHSALIKTTLFDSAFLIHLIK
ncbi:MAG: hypothetical protein IPL54_16935 [Chitinophagaceae bacterium]|nr:hypothetical protein [Chitinophagaceae bacterium]